MDIVKIAIIAIVSIIFATMLKSIRNEFSIYISMAVCLIIIFFAFDQLEIIVAFINKLSSYISINSVYIVILLKIIGIAYVSEFASGLCKDAGYGAVALQIETAGKISMLIISIPIIMALIKTVERFLG